MVEERQDLTHDHEVFVTIIETYLNEIVDYTTDTIFFDEKEAESWCWKWNEDNGKKSWEIMEDNGKRADYQKATLKLPDDVYLYRWKERDRTS